MRKQALGSARDSPRDSLTSLSQACRKLEREFGAGSARRAGSAREFGAGYNIASRLSMPIAFCCFVDHGAKQSIDLAMVGSRLIELEVYCSAHTTGVNVLTKK